MRKNYWSWALGVAIILSLAWGINNYRLLGDCQLVNENQNHQAFNSLAGHLDQLETDMAKGAVANSPNQRVLYLSQVWSQSDIATKDLSQLPADEVGLNYVSQFLTQTGDFARTLTHKVAAGGTISPEEDKTMQDMHERLLVINRKVQDLLVRINTEKLVWTNPSPSLLQRLGLSKARIAEAAAEGEEGAPVSVRNGLEQLDASLQKLPPFSYVGEFTTKTVTEPLGLPKNVITRDEAQEKAKSFLAKVGYPGVVPEYAGETQGTLGGYNWKYANVFLEVSKRGGAIVIYRDQRLMEPRALSIEEARTKAAEALKTLGWQLTITSSEDFGSYIQLEAVSDKDGIRYYPDKVRLIVALDNGQLIGLDATPYYLFHHDRQVPTNFLTMEQAKAKLRPGFELKESRLALIPKGANQEVFCWEYRGRYCEDEYLVYINAVTGLEEKIKRIIHTPRGEYLQ